jgi:hypothetical protein
MTDYALPEPLAERLAAQLQEQRMRLVRELQQIEALLMGLGQLGPLPAESATNDPVTTQPECRSGARREADHPSNENLRRGRERAHREAVARGSKCSLAKEARRA